MLASGEIYTGSDYFKLRLSHRVRQMLSIFVSYDWTKDNKINRSTSNCSHLAKAIQVKTQGGQRGSTLLYHPFKNSLCTDV